jgi:hypothetical protein
MQKKLQKLAAICASMLNYTVEHKGVLVEQDQTDLKSLSEKLSGLVTGWISASDALSIANARLTSAHTGLRKAVKASKKALEMFALGNASTVVPKIVRGSLKSRAKVDNTAVVFQKALEACGSDDPVVKSALDSLNAALETYISASTEASEKALALRGMAKDVASEVKDATARLEGFGGFISSKMSPDARDDLKRQLKNVVSTVRHKHVEPPKPAQPGPSNVEHAA